MNLRLQLHLAASIATGLLMACAVNSPAFAATPDAVTTLAGSVLTSGSMDGPAAGALFNDPTGLAMDAAGNLYIADNQNHTIRVLTPGGMVSTLAGKSGQPGGADGTGTNASFNYPSGIVLAPNGLLYVTDTGNETIRSITTNGVVNTLAGAVGVSGATNATGALAEFNSPLGIAVDAAGMLYIADSGNHLVRKVTPAGVVTTLAGFAGVWGSADGQGTNALFGKPAELKLDRNNNLFVVDSFYHTIRVISSNAVVSTIAGQGGSGGALNGLGAQARFFNPYGIAIDHNGNLRIADTYNETIRFAYTIITASLTPIPNSSGFVISWPSIAGDTYQVQFQNLAGGSAWQNLGNPVQSAGSTASTTDTSAPAAGQRFYRVVLLP